MEMSKERLEAYKSEKEEIRELQYKILHLGEGDSLIGNDVILNYRNGRPIPQSVVGYDFEKEKRLKDVYEKRLQKLRAECLEVEMWIEDIPDSITRRIFRLCYIDGMTQKKVSKVVCLDRSRISRKIDEYLKNAHKAQKAHV